MKYTIRDDIPAPEPTIADIGRPWLDIEPGQCVEVLLGGARGEATQLVAAVHNSCAYAKRKTGKEFTVRFLRDENVVRVWRTK